VPARRRGARRRAGNHCIAARTRPAKPPALRLASPVPFTLGGQRLPLRINAEDPGDAVGIGQNGRSAGRRPDDAKKDGARLVDRASIPNRRDYRNVEFRAEAQHFSRTVFVKDLPACDHQRGFRGRERVRYAWNILRRRGIV